MDDEKILLSHGSGGSMMGQLIDEVFLKEFGSGPEGQGDDAYVAKIGPLSRDGRIAISTDTFVVTPRFFPGGNIGKLAVCGTVNDVATSGADVRYLSCGFVLEEGLPIADLRIICATMAEVAHEAGVKIVTGDTKVVEKGSCDGLYINTAGVGIFTRDVSLSGRNCKPGDKILLSGTLGDHGIAVISTREGLSFSTTVESDAAPLNHMISNVLDAAPHTRCFRDPTRGGLASTLNELAAQSGVEMRVRESAVPVSDQVRGCCEMLGYDVYQVANEGKMVCIVPSEEADAALSAMRSSKYGENAAMIGEVVDNDEGHRARVLVETDFGSTRIMDMLVGEQLPRIC
ncbi:MAG: hydrogenase expression/formation protein HypE [Coriobacteriales bacterium]|jgi:hydrogenase expression/formation protein HypE